MALYNVSVFHTQKAKPIFACYKTLSIHVSITCEIDLNATSKIPPSSALTYPCRVMAGWSLRTDNVIQTHIYSF